MDLPLGSTFAVELGIFCLAAMWDWLTEKRDRSLMFVAVSFPVVVLTHQPTGLWVALICLGFTVALWKPKGKREVAKLALAAAVAAGLVLSWSFFSLVDLLSNSQGFDDINRPVVQTVVL